MKADAGRLVQSVLTEKSMIDRMEEMMGVASVDMVQRPEFMEVVNNLFARALYKDEVFAELVRSMVTQNVVTTKWFKEHSSKDKFWN